MSSRDSLTAQGTVKEILRDGAYRVELANGHRCIARAGQKNALPHLPGDSVLLAFHPYDLSRARIM